MGRGTELVFRVTPGTGKAGGRIGECVCVPGLEEQKRDLKECAECHMAGWGTVFSLMPRHRGKMLAGHSVYPERMEERKDGG